MKANGSNAPGDAASSRALVAWLLGARSKDGRWGNTQENAWAMESLVDYYRKYESETPDFTAVVNLGNEAIDRETFCDEAQVAILEIHFQAGGQRFLGLRGEGNRLGLPLEPFARAFYTAKSMGVLDKTHQALFDALHKDHLPLSTLDTLAMVR